MGNEESGGGGNQGAAAAAEVKPATDVKITAKDSNTIEVENIMEEKGPPPIPPPGDVNGEPTLIDEASVPVTQQKDNVMHDKQEEIEVVRNDSRTTMKTADATNKQQEMEKDKAGTTRGSVTAPRQMLNSDGQSNVPDETNVVESKSQAAGDLTSRSSVQAETNQYATVTEPEEDVAFVDPVLAAAQTGAAARRARGEASSSRRQPLWASVKKRRSSLWNSSDTNEWKISLKRLAKTAASTASTAAHAAAPVFQEAASVVTQSTPVLKEAALTVTQSASKAAENYQIAMQEHSENDAQHETELDLNPKSEDALPLKSEAMTGKYGGFEYQPPVLATSETDKEGERLKEIQQSENEGKKLEAIQHAVTPNSDAFAQAQGADEPENKTQAIEGEKLNVIELERKKKATEQPPESGFDIGLTQKDSIRDEPGMIRSPTVMNAMKPPLRKRQTAPNDVAPLASFAGDYNESIRDNVNPTSPGLNKVLPGFLLPQRKEKEKLGSTNLSVTSSQSAVSSRQQMLTPTSVTHKGLSSTPRHFVEMVSKKLSSPAAVQRWNGQSRDTSRNSSVAPSPHIYGWVRPPQQPSFVYEQSVFAKERRSDSPGSLSSRGSTQPSSAPSTLPPPPLLDPAVTLWDMIPDSAASGTEQKEDAMLFEPGPNDFLGSPIKRTGSQHEFKSVSTCSSEIDSRPKSTGLLQKRKIFIEMESTSIASEPGLKLRKRRSTGSRRQSLPGRSSEGASIQPPTPQTPLIKRDTPHQTPRMSPDSSITKQLEYDDAVFEEMFGDMMREDSFDVALFSFSSLTELDFLPNVSTEDLPDSLEFLATVRWRQLVAFWKHSEIMKGMTMRPCSHHYLHDTEFNRRKGGSTRSSSSTRSVNGSSHPQSHSRGGVVLSNETYRQKPSTKTANLSGFSPRLSETGLSTISTFLSSLGPIGTNSPVLDKRIVQDPQGGGNNDKAKRPQFLPLRSNVSMNEPSALNKLANSHLPQFSQLIKEIALSAELNLGYKGSDASGFDGVAYSVNVKGVDAIRKKAKTKYNGDASQVKDVLRAQLVFPDEGSLICGLSALRKICDKSKAGANANHAGSKPIKVDIVRTKNLFRLSTLGSVVPSNLPTGYRHLLINLRINDGIIAEIQFQLAQMFNILGAEGYSLHRDLVDTETVCRLLRGKNGRSTKLQPYHAMDSCRVEHLIEKIVAFHRPNDDIVIGGKSNGLGRESSKPSAESGNARRSFMTADLAAATMGTSRLGSVNSMETGIETSLDRSTPAFLSNGGIAAAAAAAALTKAKRFSQEESSSASVAKPGGIAAAAASAALLMGETESGSGTSATLLAEPVGIAAAAAAAALSKAKRDSERASSLGSVAKPGATASEGSSRASISNPGGIAAAAAAAAALSRDNRKVLDGSSSANVAKPAGVAAAAAASALRKGKRNSKEGSLPEFVAKPGGIAAAAAAAALSRGNQKSVKDPSSAFVSKPGGIAAAAAAAALAKNKKSSSSASVAKLIAEAKIEEIDSQHSQNKQDSTRSEGGLMSIAAAAAAAASRKREFDRATSAASKSSTLAEATRMTSEEVKNVIKAADPINPSPIGALSSLAKKPVIGIADAAAAAAARKFARTPSQASAREAGLLGNGVAKDGPAMSDSAENDIVRIRGGGEPLGGGLSSIAAAAAAAAARKRKPNDASKTDSPSVVGIAAAAAAAARKREEESKTSFQDQSGGSSEASPILGGGIAAAAAAAAKRRQSSGRKGSLSEGSRRIANAGAVPGPLIGGGGIAAAAAAAALARSRGPDSQAQVGALLNRQRQSPAPSDEGDNEDVNEGVAAAAAATALRRSRASKEKGAPLPFPGGGIAAAAAAAAALRTKNSSTVQKEGSADQEPTQKAVPKHEDKDSNQRQKPEPKPERHSGSNAKGSKTAAALDQTTDDYVVNDKLDKLRKEGPQFSEDEVLNAIMKVASKGALESPRDVAAFYAIYFLSTFRAQRSKSEKAESLKQSSKESDGSTNDSDAKPTGNPSSIDDDLERSEKALLRCLVIANQAVSVGMMGWLEYGSSNLLERSTERPYDIMSRLACLYVQGGDWRKATDVLQALVLRCEQHLPLYHPMTLSAMLDLSAALAMNSCFEHSRRIAGRASQRLALYLAEQEESFLHCRDRELRGENTTCVTFEDETGMTYISAMRAFVSILHRLLKRNFTNLLGRNHDVLLLNHCFLGDSLSVLANCLGLIEGDTPADEVNSQYFWNCAYDHYRLALTGWIQRKGRNHLNVVTTSCAMARCLGQLGKQETAVNLLSGLLSRKKGELTNDKTKHVTHKQEDIVPMVFFSPSKKSPQLNAKICIGREQATALSLWTMATLFVETNSDERGRIRALSLLHASSEALQRALRDAEQHGMEDEYRESCLQMLLCIEEEARELFEPLESVERNMAGNTMAPNDDRETSGKRRGRRQRRTSTGSANTQDLPVTV